MIPRIIINTIENARQHFPCVLVTGPRQVGKSTLIRNAYEGNGYNYVSLDDTLEKNLAIGDPRTFLEIHPWPVVIDEAQKAPELFPEIERIINEQRSRKGNKDSAGMFIITGSSRHQLLEKAEESLAGRVGIINMDALSISEIAGRQNIPFLTDISKTASRKTDTSFEFENIFDYVVNGGLPQLYDDPDTPRDIFFSSYISTYIEKDLREILEVKDEVKFINFMRLLASNTGQELIYDNYAKEIGIDATTVKAWISALNKTGIIYLLQPYNEQSIKKRIVKRPKMYFFDTGLAAYLSGIDTRNTLVRSFLKGRFFETFVINEIRRSFQNEGIQIDYYYYRDNNQNEIDLVYVRDGEIHMIEIKAGTSFTVSSVKGFKQLDNTAFIKGKNAIVCTADKVSALTDGTLLIPVSTI